MMESTEDNRGFVPDAEYDIAKIDYLTTKFENAENDAVRFEIGDERARISWILKGSLSEQLEDEERGYVQRMLDNERYDLAVNQVRVFEGKEPYSQIEEEEMRGVF